MIYRIAYTVAAALIASIILVIILGDKYNSDAFNGTILGVIISDWFSHKDNYFGK